MQNKNTQLAFEGHDLYIGLDVHKKSWKVSIMSEHLFHKTFSQDPDAKKLGNYLRKNFPGGIYYSAYEAGFCGFSIHHQLQEEGIHNVVVNPADIPTTDKDRRQKEDTRDSRKISKALRNNELTEIHVPQRSTEELRQLLKSRSDIVKELTRYKNRIKSLLSYFGISIPVQFTSGSKHFSRAYINWLSQVSFQTQEGKYALDNHIEIVKFLRGKLLETNRVIRKVSKSEIYSKNFKLLKSVPGLGLITAMNLLAELEDINRFKNFDQLCSYVGIVPSTNSSGEQDRVGPITNRSNRHLRGMLVESAWVAARTDPALTIAYEKLCKKMKPSKAIIRITKKLLSRIRYVLINQQAYEYNTIK